MTVTQTVMSGYLLDTHAAIWFFDGNELLS
jgi:PIN domain nuclease of toxin-antitoxin system